MARKALSVDRGAVQRDVDSHKGGGKFHTFEEGSNYIRVLPPIEGLCQKSDEGAFYYGLMHQHGAQVEGRFKSFRCLHDVGKWCPYCSAREIFDEIAKTKGEEEGEKFRKAARNFFASPRYALNVIIGKLAKDKKSVVANEDAGIVIVQVSNSLIEKMEAVADDFGDFYDPEEGFWIVVKRKGTGNETRYPTVLPSRRSMGPLPEWVDFDDAHDLMDPTLVPERKQVDMRMLLIDRYGDVVDDLEDRLKKKYGQWKRKNKKGE